MVRNDGRYRESEFWKLSVARHNGDGTGEIAQIEFIREQPNFKYERLCFVFGLHSELQKTQVG